MDPSTSKNRATIPRRQPAAADGPGTQLALLADCLVVTALVMCGLAVIGMIRSH